MIASSVSLENKVRKFALVTALLVIIGVPLGYFWISFDELKESLDFKAKVKASALTSLVANNPDVWMLAENRLQGLISREPVPLDHEFVQVIDSRGEVLTKAGKLPAGPLITRSYPIYDVDTPVGRISVSASMQPLFKSIQTSFFLSLLLGLAIYYVVKTLPLKALRKAIEDLYMEKERAQTTLYSIADAVITSDSSGVVDYLNPAAERLLGLPALVAKGKPLGEVIKLREAGDKEILENYLESALKTDSYIASRDNAELLRSYGGWLAVEAQASPLHDSNGKLSGGVLVLRDVSEARKYLERRSWEATHDPLTGLFNRREFEARVAQALNDCKDSGRSYAVCYMDLDRFKLINDTFGHGAGDALLGQISSIIQKRIRDSDALARLGGDEFGLLLEGCDSKRSQLIGADIVAAVNEYKFLWDNRISTVGISIGLTIITPEHASVSEILREADCACYWAKEHGKNRVLLFVPSDMNLAARRSETGWVMRINDAFRDDRFELYKQAYRTLGQENGRVHLEILLRMRGEDGELIEPGRFLPAAERYNLMPEIDRWVVKQVFSGYAGLKAGLGVSELTCAVNLSGATLNSSGFFDFVRKHVAEHKLEPGSICFELTESVAVSNLQAAAEFIRLCKEIGLTFALDDFGTGTSSFGYLKHLPVDYLKIDGSFVRNIEHDKIDLAMVESINRIGHILGKLIVAEYAENENIIATLKTLGLDFAQGFGVSKPVPLFPDKPKPHE